MKKLGLIIGLFCSVGLTYGQNNTYYDVQAGTTGGGSDNCFIGY